MSHEDHNSGCFSFSRPSFRSVVRHGKLRQARGPKAHQVAETLPSKEKPPIVTNLLKGEDIRLRSDIPSKEQLPAYSSSAADSLALSAAVLQTTDGKIDEVNADLRNLSLLIHGHPELSSKETFAHDTLTKYMASQGFTVTTHYLGVQTAFRASFKHGTEGPVIGINSEMDALPGMGHACGHNLIAMAGVGVALGVKAAFEKHNIAGEVVLLGTPAEEKGGGKVVLLDRGGYADMDACVMCHPGPGTSGQFEILPSLAVQSLSIEYSGRTAHAAGAPWDGINALDAAVIAYTSISALRQQIKPEYRVNGIIEGNNWAPNIIPDYAKLVYNVRAPTGDEAVQLTKRITACFDAAALATGCTQKITQKALYKELCHNPALAREFIKYATQRYNMTYIKNGTTPGSTDFGNISQVVPCLHPQYMIPAASGNHTVGFADAACTEEAHAATLRVIKSLAAIGLLLCSSPVFLQEVKDTFKKSRSQ